MANTTLRENAPEPTDSEAEEADNIHRLERSGAPQPTARDAGRETEATAQAAAPDDDARSVKRSWKRPLLFGALPLALVVGAYFYVTGGAVMSTDNAYVQADTVGLSTDVSGVVSQVLVHDNQQVAKGDVLFKLDDLPFRLALERADAQLGTTRNELVAMQANYKNVQSEVAQAKTDVEFNTLNFNRQQQLATHNYTPQATFDASRNTLQASQRKLASITQQLAGIAASLNGDPNAPVEDHPRYKEALAARNEAARQLAHAVVKAPYDGIVTNVPALQPGQFLAAATTAFNIVSTDHVWVQASPKETELTYVKPGQAATITVDTYPGETWTGTVESISPASASSFSLLPAENSSGNWVKVVQRIPIRVRIDHQPGKPPLRVGMSVGLDIDTGHPRGLPHALTGWFGAAGDRHG